ncbi:MAG: hypothetical protein HYY52_00095 [Candidatus Melainabacteria bacterium]|nr:hypothetical protein [Candidatus Melainabacteria bacterium]
MKIYKLNSLTTFLVALLIISLVTFLPITMIELFWNTAIGKNFTDLTVNFWQALILWLIILITLSILGIFKFEFVIETHKVTDKDLLDKNLLKRKIESLQSESEKTPETEISIKRDKEEGK